MARQNDRERVVGMVQAGMTRHAVADHFDVSRITISRLMIRLRKKGRRNDRPRSSRSRVTLPVEHLVWQTSEFQVD